MKKVFKCLPGDRGVENRNGREGLGQEEIFEGIKYVDDFDCGDGFRILRTCARVWQSVIFYTLNTCSLLSVMCQLHHHTAIKN